MALQAGDAAGASAEAAHQGKMKLSFLTISTLPSFATSTDSSKTLPPRSPTSHLDNLPSEILSVISNILRESKQFRSLAALATSCRQLYTATIVSLYKDICIDSERGIESLLWALAMAARNPSRRGVTEQGQGQRLGAAVQGGGLLENLKLTKRVTLGALPKPDYGDRLREVLHLYSHPTRVEMLCPNATFLRIAPLQPYIPKPQSRSQDGRLAYADNHFLGQLCRPQAMCLDNVLGRHADLRTPLDGSHDLTYDLLRDHIDRLPWGDQAIPVMSWHGALVERYGATSPILWNRGFNQEFGEIRLFVSNNLDIRDTSG